LSLYASFIPHDLSQRATGEANDLHCWRFGIYDGVVGSWIVMNAVKTHSKKLAYNDNNQPTSKNLGAAHRIAMVSTGSPVCRYVNCMYGQ